MTAEEFEKLEEVDIRMWFVRTDLEQALDTYRVVTGILEARREAQPKRKTRSDAGKRKDSQEPLIDLRELGKP